MRHTSGQWGQFAQSNETILIKSGTVEIARINPNISEALDNSRLIAAAPELLEACIKAFDNLRNGESKTKYRLIECLNSLEEAIKKAKGE